MTDSNAEEVRSYIWQLQEDLMLIRQKAPRPPLPESLDSPPSEAEFLDTGLDLATDAAHLLESAFNLKGFTSNAPAEAWIQLLTANLYRRKVRESAADLSSSDTLSSYHLADLARALPNLTTSIANFVEDLNITFDLDTEDAFHESQIGDLLRRAISLASTVRVAGLVKTAEDGAARVAQVQHDVASAAGDVATGTLAEAFKTYSSDQKTTANRWMWLTIVMLVLVLAAGFYFLQGAGGQSWQATIAHLVIALPAAGAAAFCARESSRHRESSRWAGRVAAQLNAIGPYVARLNETNRETLWVNFGNYIFGPAVAQAENQLNTIPPELLSAMSDLVKRTGRS